MKKILVLGASGGVGKQVVQHALEAGHAVTALVRDPAKTFPPHERLTVVTGGVVDDPLGLDRAMQDQAVVISAIGRGQSFKSNDLIARCVPPLLASMKAHGVRRLIFTSALGVGESMRDTPLLAQLFMRTLLRGIYADKIAGESHIRNSDLDWTLVQPAQLSDGALTRKYRVGERLVMSGMPSVSRADVAHFIVGEVDSPAYVRKVAIVSN
jgi:putative NADH-flavin reductase